MTSAHRVLSPNQSDPTAAGLCALAVMTKVPRPGHVKTRLTPPLTSEEAAALNICFLRDTAAAIALAGAGSRGLGCYTPIGAEHLYDDILPTHFQLIPQRGNSFGERLTCATEDLLKVGFASVCLINSDSPTLPARIFSEAVEVLALPNESLVLGPSDDGGYYLIGMKQLHRKLFEEIDWSTERVCQQSLRRAAELNLDVHLLPSWYDVDDPASLERLAGELLGPNESADRGQAPFTRRFLQEIVAREGAERISPSDLANARSR
jgi:uncharacterized protein